MEWTTPSYAEIKMDAEIGSYQEDRDPGEPTFVDRAEAGEQPAPAAAG